MRAKGKKPQKRLKVSMENRLWFLDVIPFFGIAHPSIDDAAELIVVDKVFSGDYKDKIPKKFDSNPKNPLLLEALAEEIDKFKARLVSAVEKGQLKAEPIKKDIDDNLRLEICHIKAGDLADWLANRGHQVGEYFKEYLRSEFKISEHVCNEIAFMRKSQESEVEAEGSELIKKIENDPKFKNPKIEKLIRLYRSAIAENARIEFNKRERKQNVVDAPLMTRTKRTMLTIIAALCEKANINFQERGAARRIMEATETLGAPVDDETIRNLLNEIEDAVESRSKDSLEASPKS